MKTYSIASAGSSFNARARFQSISHRLALKLDDGVGGECGAGRRAGIYLWEPGL
jgi:hypothetical protein